MITKHIITKSVITCRTQKFSMKLFVTDINYQTFYINRILFIKQHYMISLWISYGKWKACFYSGYDTNNSKCDTFVRQYIFQTPHPFSQLFNWFGESWTAERVSQVHQTIRTSRKLLTLQRTIPGGWESIHSQVTFYRVIIITLHYQRI